MQAIAQNQVLVVIGETGSGKTTDDAVYGKMGYSDLGVIGCTLPSCCCSISSKEVAEEYGYR